MTSDLFLDLLLLNINLVRSETETERQIVVNQINDFFNQPSIKREILLQELLVLNKKLLITQERREKEAIIVKINDLLWNYNDKVRTILNKTHLQLEV